uniref:Uncharacterized protein n=1 Tax=Cacopsylla melanoneura TaxID=428564 RepID=A0A8D8TXY4_9HEMI
MLSGARADSQRWSTGGSRIGPVCSWRMNWRLRVSQKNCQTRTRILSAPARGRQVSSISCENSAAPYTRRPTRCSGRHAHFARPVERRGPGHIRRSTFSSWPTRIK